jgi:hypothetical protein
MDDGEVFQASAAKCGDWILWNTLENKKQCCARINPLISFFGILSEIKKPAQIEPVRLFF